jgi:lipoprotein-anchoring transpeptidase ErfK/SrfK
MDIFISLPAQTLEVFDDAIMLHRFSVSTAKKGAGEEIDSYRTPRGRHVIRAKIGGGKPINTVFVGRRPTGEIWTPDLAARFPGRDWMLTRILWLSGKEPGVNRMGTVDTMRRYIYLHGSPDTVAMGEPGSIGCVRMRNSDIVELFDRVPTYTPVNIGEFHIQVGDWPSMMDRAYALLDRVCALERGMPPPSEQRSTPRVIRSATDGW